MSIVALTDLSEHSRAALRQGAVLASALHTSLEALHALDLFGDMDDAELLRVDPERLREDALAEASLILERAVDRALVGLPATPPVALTARFGYPEEEALLAAERAEVTALVVGKSGQGRVVDELFGTTTGRLVRESAAPTLVVPDTWARDTVRTILAPVDLSTCSLASLRHAAGLADAFGAQLHVLHAAMLPHLPSTTVDAMTIPLDLPEFHAQRAERLERWLTSHDLASHVTSTSLATDTPHHAILTTAEALDADLICMGTHGRRHLARLLLGNTAERVLRGTSRPVMVVREG